VTARFNAHLSEQTLSGDKIRSGNGKTAQEGTGAMWVQDDRSGVESIRLKGLRQAPSTVSSSPVGQDLISGLVLLIPLIQPVGIIARIGLSQAAR
jgi:hypothetical protein